MKVKKILKKMYAACLEHDSEKEKRMWVKALKKSFKHKHTYAIK
jgi:hypothetical protein